MYLKKWILSLTVIVLFSLSCLAQSNNGINYKAIIKDNNGNIVANELIEVQFQIMKDIGMELIYHEQHTVTTNANGLVVLIIGEGTSLGAEVEDLSDVEWNDGVYFYKVLVDIGDGLVDMGTDLFKSVPYALQAESAKTASNVSGLEVIDEGNGIGWRLKGRNPDNYGNIGLNAVDISYSNSFSTTYGAVGNLSMATGNSTTASGIASTAMGRNTIAPSYEETVIGSYNTFYTPNSIQSWNENDRLFVIGNGTGIGVNRSNALIILKNGTITAPSFDVAEITDNKALITKEYFDINGSSGLEAIDEGNGFGWRLKGRNPDNYGDIGNGAVDFSYSFSNIFSSGATGEYSTALGYITHASGSYSITFGEGTIASNRASIAMGHNTQSSGRYSTATGFFTHASGNSSIAMGSYTNAPSFAETVVGQYNTDYSPNNDIGWNENDRLFVIGNGTSTSNKRDALTVLKNGTTTLNSSLNSNPDLVLGGTTDSAAGDDGIIASDPAYTGSDLFLRSNDAVVIELDHDNNETGQFEIKNGGGTIVFEVDESGTIRQNGSTIHSSDRRLKKDIEDLPYGLDEVLQLQPKTYNWKDHEQDKKSLGLIAQEVQPIICEIVNQQDDADKTLGISYTELIPVIINAIKEQQTIIENQNRKIIQLESLESRIEQLEALLNKTKNKI